MRKKVLAGALAVAVLLSSRPARAYEGANGLGDVGAHTATSIGGRAAYYRLPGSGSGQWSPGAQLRLHLSPSSALEASADFNHTTIPLQASFLKFLSPDASISPYILFGGGLYKTRFGPHAGAGLQLLLDGNWSVDGSYRFLWSQALHSSPLGQSFRDRGYMITAALNYRL